MSIKYVILGYLGWQPMTGYDVKKLIADAETLPWTANNNQIYRALVDLHQDGWVDKQIEEGVGSPNRHVYSITDAGRAALKRWVQSEPELPEMRKPFLHQLMWADSLAVAELDELLDRYRTALNEKLFMIRVQADEKPDMPGRTPREAFLWERIYQNWIEQYELELRWVRQLRDDLGALETARQRELARQRRS